MKYKFEKLTMENLEATKSEWVALLDDVTFNPNGYYQFIEAAESRLQGNAVELNSYTYVVISDESEAAIAMFDIVHALPKSPDSWVKVLGMRTSPLLDLRFEERVGDTQFDRREKIGSVIAFGLSKVVGLIYGEMMAGKIKVWGNKQVDIDIFMIFKRELEADPATKAGLNVHFENVGGWLEITKK
ncbi:MAG: hypothetical protein ACJA0N_000686 [Pseudohongiellaceae bacterium]|jgi:hypothetical protein